MEIKTAWKQAVWRLKEAGVPEPEMDAWYLLEYATGVTRAAYYTNPDREMPKDETERFLYVVQKREQRIPLQHITGVQDFMGYEFLVNASVLIPRQDTEILVEEAVGLLKHHMCLLDLCTGSGCILLSLLKIAEERGIEEIRGIGTDISGDALKIAEKNKSRLFGQNGDIMAEFLEGDLWEPIREKYGEKMRFDLIVSNPPYISEEEIRSLQEEVRLYDPYIALDGGKDGLCFYREIIGRAPQYLKMGGTLLLEIGCSQGEAVKVLMEEAGFWKVVVKKDLAGLDRVISGVYDS
ncbi:MAG: peptide chain release factor N(5)-glutamine methyltransferase [Hespellia sp.]|nr:peptide chain release factor N(5)-glutamine methyltransferase [Hespellia sp.]